MAQSDFSPKKEDHENIAPVRDDRSNRSSGSIIPTKLYVKRIPETVTSEELHDLFSQFGSVTECAIIRSYAFIHFSKPEEATRAVNELNGFRFMGVILEIEHSKSQSKGRRLSNRRDIYRKEENRGMGMGMGMGMGRRERDRSPAYTGAYRADPYSPEAGYGGGYEYGQGGYGGYSEGYGGYMGHPYRSPGPRRGGFGPSGPRYPPPLHPGPPPQQYSNYPPHSPTGYQTYGPPRPRPPPPPPTGYYPPS